MAVIGGGNERTHARFPAGRRPAPGPPAFAAQNAGAFQNGNFWYNQRTIGIEHVGVDATGYQWYNATEYLGSAKLAAYLLAKYNIPLDHEHLMSHGTTPAPTLGTSPNHVDPGPYWLWDYCLGLINQQGVPFATGTTPSGVIRLSPASGQQPDGSGGTETTANFNFFYLYTQPSTASATLPSKGSPGDITDESNNVETMISYDTLAQQPDAAGTGDTMYEIWYGAALSPSTGRPSLTVCCTAGNHASRY